MSAESNLSGTCWGCCRRSWPHIFRQDRNPFEEESYVETKLKLRREFDASLTSDLPSVQNLQSTNSREQPPEEPNILDPLKDEPDHLELFLRDCKDDDPTAAEEAIADFCHGIHRSILKRPERRERGAAWLDDRLHIPNHNPTGAHTSTHQTAESRGRDQSRDKNPQSKGTTSDHASIEDGTSHSIAQDASATLLYRKYDSPLSAAALHNHLEEKQFGHAILPDADKRLICIYDLSPSFVYALTETAPLHQVPALKDALYRHLASQTYMGVRISTKGYTTFQMQFHIPFYARRRGRPKTCLSDGDRVETLRTWRDISFLACNRPEASKQPTWGIYEAHMSFTICGVADSRWVGYAFFDTEFDESRAMTSFDFDYDSIVTDVIAADGDVDANKPIWNPREYFLLIIKIRMCQVVDEWEKLICMIEKGIGKQTDRPPPVQSPTLIPKDDRGTMATFERTQKALEFLRHLSSVLSGTNKTWKRFSSIGGDIGYFQDFENMPEPSQKSVQGLLQEIRSKFDELDDFQQRLETLTQSCQTTADILQLKLTLESNQAAKLSGFITELMVVWVSPVAVVSAFFAIPEPFGNFHRNGASFTVAFIIVWGFLRLLIFINEWGTRPRHLWQKAKDTKEKVYPRFWGRMGALRKGRLSRSDTESTLVAAKASVSDA